MKLCQLICIALLGIGVWALPIDAATADTLYDSSGFVQGQQSFVQSFDITSPGTLTVSLSDIPWLDTISNLNFFLTTTTGPMGGSMGQGTESINVGPGVVFAHWFGDANGIFGVGAYGIKIEFQPSTPVPLPPSLPLALSGLLVFFGCRRLNILSMTKR
jgi:hypothetical protein